MFGRMNALGRPAVIFGRTSFGDYRYPGSCFIYFFFPCIIFLDAPSYYYVHGIIITSLLLSPPPAHVRRIRITDAAAVYTDTVYAP
jgi:hypothetical protein